MEAPIKSCEEQLSIRSIGSNLYIREMYIYLSWKLYRWNVENKYTSLGKSTAFNKYQQFDE